MTKGEIAAALERWLRAWDEHDLETVIDLFHADAVFETWTGLRIRGKERIHTAWKDWFAAGGFHFEREDLLIDEAAQAAVFVWRYEGPPLEGGGRDACGGGAGGVVTGGEGDSERRRGVDLIRFRDGAIVEKIAYSKTFIEHCGVRLLLRP